ncbi:MAG: LysE family translocator, partial [Pseudomonadota bacterium]
ILTFVGLFTALEKAGNASSLTVQSLVVVGVFLGSAMWWLFLAGIATKIGARIGAGALGWIDRASGILIFGFGVLALHQVLG